MTSTTVSLRACKTSRDAKRLMYRHFCQIVRRSDEEHDQLCGTVAITFRPGDRTSNFLGKQLRPVGAALMAVMEYDHGPNGRRMALRGYRAQVTEDGSAKYDLDQPLFHKNAAARPRTSARGAVLDPMNNPSLLEMALRMDKSCQRTIGRSWLLAKAIRLPKVLLGFAPTEPPAYEATAALRALAAEQLEVPVNRLGSNGTVLLDRLMRDLFEQSFIPASAPINSSGLLLLPAALCTQGRKALRVFEDFSELLGAPSWNPAREVRPFEAVNPASAVLTQSGINTAAANYINSLDQPQVDAVEMAMRQAIGPMERIFTTAEIYDALLAPGTPIRAWSAALPQLRAKLAPFDHECASDDDLLLATLDPRKALLLSGASRIQVIRGLGCDGGGELQSEFQLDQHIAMQFGLRPQANDALIKCSA